MTHRRGGMSLIEVLIVMIIIALLAMALVVMIAGLIERQKVTKTAAMIKALSDGCNTYYTNFKVYPPTGSPSPYTGSKNLHYYLAGELKVILTVQPRTERTDRPILTNFSRDWLDGNPTSTNPGSAPRKVVDAWGGEVDYLVPGPGDMPFLIRSYGPDKVIGGGDDVNNQSEEF